MALIESHPLLPFLPDNARLLMLGSFPPQRKRWTMDFFYPNFNNDMWRIFGIVFFGDKNHFLINDRKTFCKEKIVDFLTEKGIAVYDTASVVRRLSDNASDKFLDIVQPTDIGALLDTIPHCTVIVATGQKAADVLARQFGIIEPKTGEYAAFPYSNRCLRFYRMPSSSRAYPLKLENKAEIYRKMFDESGIA